MEELHIQDAAAVEIREVYLSQMQISLSKSHSPREVFETVIEMREHLNAIARADMELGASCQTAMLMAVKTFGQADFIAGSMSKGRRLNLKPLDLPVFTRTVTLGLGLSSLPVLAVNAYAAFEGSHGGPSESVLTRFLFTLPMFLGMTPLVIALAFAAHVTQMKPLRLATIVGIVYGLWSAVQTMANGAMILEARVGHFPQGGFDIVGRMFLTSAFLTGGVFIVTLVTGIYDARARLRRVGRVA
jgi:hypothetical protein